MEQTKQEKKERNLRIFKGTYTTVGVSAVSEWVVDYVCLKFGLHPDAIRHGLVVGVVAGKLGLVYRLVIAMFQHHLYVPLISKYAKYL